MESGTRSNGNQDPSTGPLETVGRLIGFFMFAAPAMAIFAGLVLLPVYKHYSDTQYQLECLKSKVAQAEDFKKANDRFKTALKEDEVLNVRLIMSQSTLTPANEIVVHDPDASSHRPVSVVAARRPLPPRAPDKLLDYAVRIENTNTQRGLFLMAAGAMLAALFFFSPMPRSRKPVSKPL